jgi:hypothetical protein
VKSKRRLRLLRGLPVRNLKFKEAPIGRPELAVGRAVRRKSQGNRTSVDRFAITTTMFERGPNRGEEAAR